MWGLVRYSLTGILFLDSYIAVIAALSKKGTGIVIVLQAIN
jgi:hypothetical protein